MIYMLHVLFESHIPLCQVVNLHHLTVRYVPMTSIRRSAPVLPQMRSFAQEAARAYRELHTTAQLGAATPGI